MQPITRNTAPSEWRHATPSTRATWTRCILLILILLVALFLRVYRLDEIPAGVDYDEAGNLILAREIAAGQSRPIFIRAYAGREAVFYWLAAASLAALGPSLFAFRLAAALCGVGTVLLAYALGREMFHDERPLERQWVPLIGAALMAVSYWHVHVSRYGYRVNAMTLLVAATMTYLWRGLRRRRRLDLVAAGVLAGLSANTYLAVRAFPLVLGAFALWVILTWRPTGRIVPYPAPGARQSLPEERGGQSWRWLRARQFALFGLAAVVALAPLGAFFLRHPTYFGTRMSQTSLFDPAIHGGDLWGTLGRVTLDALGIFTVRGDSNPVYNLDERPIFSPLLGGFFYLGLLASVWALFAPGRPPRRRTPYLLTLVWLPVMLLPNILGARGVPHSLRAIGLVPVVYYLPALGFLTLARGWGWVHGRLRGRSGWLAPQERGSSSVLGGSGARHRRFSPMGPLLVLVLLVIGAVGTYQAYFVLWTQDAEAYYRGAADVRAAAAYLSQWDPDQVTLMVSNDTYRHTTIAAFATNYDQLRWISGSTLVFPAGGERPTLYVFDHTNPLDPALARYIPSDTLQHRELGPDGRVGFEAYLIPPDRMPSPEPQVPVNVDLGHTLDLMGYDVNGPATSGDMLDVTLYWRVLRQVDRDDYAFFAHIVDDLGFRWGGETFFHYPSLQWVPGDVMLFRQRIPIAPGAPPDTYALDVGAFSPSLDARLPVLSQDGQMQGTAMQVGPFQVARAPAPSNRPPIQQPLAARFGSALSLLGFDRDRGDLRPGESLALSLYWQADGKAEAAEVSLWLDGPGGHLGLWQGHPVHGRYPFEQWQPPELVRDRYALHLPTDAPAGDYELRLALLRPNGRPLPDSDGDGWLSLSTIHVLPTDRRWEPPAYTHPVGAQLGDVVELLGYDLDQSRVEPDETLRLTLVWRCLGQMDVSYTVFTHLLGPEGQIRGQKDNPPVGGSYPTTLWVPGEVVVDEYTITVHPDARIGTYVLEVGMYDPSNMQRLSVHDPTGAIGDRILLGNLEVVPRD